MAERLFPRILHYTSPALATMWRLAGWQPRPSGWPYNSSLHVTRWAGAFHEVCVQSDAAWLPVLPEESTGSMILHDDARTGEATWMSGIILVHRQYWRHPYVESGGPWNRAVRGFIATNRPFLEHVWPKPSLYPRHISLKLPKRLRLRSS